MTLKEIMQEAENLRYSLWENCEDERIPDIVEVLIRVHNEALEAAALTVNPGHEHNPNNTPCDGCLLEEASFDVLDLIIHPTPTAEQDK